MTVPNAAPSKTNGRRSGLETRETVESRDSGSLPRPTQDRRRSFGEIIKAQFRAVARAIIQTLAPSPKLRRKRREETGKAFKLAARNRVLRRPPPRFETPPLFLQLPETLDWMNPHYRDAGIEEDDAPPVTDFPFPEP